MNMKNFPKRLMAGILLSLFLFSCGGGSGGSTASQSSSVQSFSLVETPEQLTQKYRDLPVYGVITLEFNRQLQAASGRSESGDSNDVLQWVRVYDAQGNPVSGNVVVSAVDRTITFVPSSFLRPSASYKVVVSSTVTADDGDMLGKDVVFDVSTSNVPPLEVIKAPDTVVSSSTFHVSARSEIPVAEIEWFVRDNGEIKHYTGEDADISFDETGIHTVKVTVQDSYSRRYSENIDITVLPDSMKRLVSSGDVTSAQYLSIDDVGSASLEEALNHFSEDVLSISGAIEQKRALEDMVLRTKAITVKPKRLNNIKSYYISKLIENGSFVGVVSFEGFPAIFSYRKGDDNRCLLEILVDDYGMDLHIKKGGYVIDVSTEKMNRTPEAFFGGIELACDFIEVLKKKLGRSFANPLPIFYTKNNRAVLVVPRRQRGIVSWAKEIVGDIGSGAQNAFDFLSSLVSEEVYSAFSSLKNLAKTISNLGVFGSKMWDSFKSLCSNVNDDFVSLYNRFKDDPAGVLSGVADPDKLIMDLKNFCADNTGPSVKKFIKNIMSGIKSIGDVIGVVDDFFEDKKEQFSQFIGSFSSINRDAALYANYNNGVAQLGLQVGSNTYSVSASTIETFKKYSSAFLQKVGDFPIDYFVSALQSLTSAMPSTTIGLFYASSDSELRYLFKVGSVSNQRCKEDENSKFCLGEYFNPMDLIVNELAVRPFSHLGVVVWFAPLEPVLPDIEDSGALYSYLRMAGPRFPDLGLEIDTRYRNNYITITGSTLPAIGLSAAVEFAVEFDYHLLFGGKGKAGLILSVGVDPGTLTGGVVNALEGIVKSAFQSSLSFINSSIIKQETLPNGKKIVKLTFPDDSEFISFLKDFVSNIKEGLAAKGLSGIANSITFTVGIEGEGGVGVGAGGTGTGGVGADLKLGAELDFSVDLNFVVRFLSYMIQYDVNAFIITPLKEIAEFYKNAGDDTDASEFYSDDPIMNAVKLYSKAFNDIFNAPQVPQQQILNLSNSLAEHMSIGVSIKTEAEGEAEEGGSGSVEVSAAPNLSINGEAFLNMIYPIFGGDSKYFDHAGIFPVVTFTMPVSAELELGVDEALKATLKTSLQADFFSASVEIKNDPYISSGIHKTSTVLKFPLNVRVDSSLSSAAHNDRVVFTCNATPSATSIEWFINGYRVNTEGAFTHNGKVVTHISFPSTNKIALTGTVSGEIVATCVAKNGDQKAFGSSSVTVESTLQGTPILGIDNETVMSLQGNSIEVSGVSDKDNSTIKYEVEIAENADFVNPVAHFIASNNKIAIPGGLNPSRKYYIRVRAFNEYYDYSAWSTPRSFFTSVALKGIKPLNNATFEVGKEIEFGAEVVAEGGDDLLLGLDPVIQISSSSDFNSLVTQLSYDEMSGFETWKPDVPGRYYWRVVGYFSVDEHSTPEQITSDVYTLLIKPAPPELRAPDNASEFSHRKEIYFESYPITNTDEYQLQIAYDSDFHSIYRESEPSASYRIKERLPTLDQQPYKKTLFWRMRRRENGVWSDWSTTRILDVVNHPPIAYFQEISSKTYCINDNVTVDFYINDQDADNVTMYKAKIIQAATGQLIKLYVKTGNFNADQSFTAPASQIGYGRYLGVQIIPADQWGSSIENSWSDEEIMEYYFANRWPDAIFDIVNCPPEAPSDISGPDGNVMVGNECYFIVDSQAKDPDGDEIAYYEFVITDPSGVKHTFQAEFGSLGYASITFTPEQAGTYTWKVRAVARYKDGENTVYQPGAWSEQRSFFAGETVPITDLKPADGSIITGSDGVVLRARPSDNADRVQFEWSNNDEFENSHNSGWVISKDSDGYYVYQLSFNEQATVFWHARPGYSNNSGPWSETYCFSYIPKLPTPVFYAFSDVFYPDADGITSLRFDADEDTILSDCHKDNGTFYYRICTDKSCDNVTLMGTFKPASFFDVSLPSGTYYFEAYQDVGGIQTDYSSPVEFTISKETISAGLVGYWSFDNCSEGSTQVQDESGNNNNGSVVGEVDFTYEAAKNKSLYLTGSQYVKIGKFSLNTFTISAWVKPDNVTGEHTIAGNPENSGFGIEIYNGKVRGYVYVGDGYLYVEGIGIPQYVWSFVTVTYDGNTLKVYVDGKLAGEGTKEGSVVQSNLDFLIGANPGLDPDQPVSMQFQGFIDEVRLYNRALSDDEIKDVMQHDGVAFTSGASVIDDFVVSPAQGTLPLDVTLTCQMQTEGAVFNWDFDGDGYYDEETETPSVNHTYKYAGSFTPVVYVVNENWMPTWERSTVIVNTQNSLEIYFPFDGNVIDASGNERNGTALNATWCSGESGTAVALEGELSGVDVDISENPITLTSFRVVFWVKLNAINGNGNVFLSATNESEEKELSLRVVPGEDGGGEMEVCIKGVCKQSLKNVNIADGNWHKLEYIYFNGDVSITIDGDAYDSLSFGSGTLYLDKMIIGNVPNPEEVKPEPLNGCIDELMLYSSAPI